ncbi:MAG: DUF167 domain-containing protein [Phycisphaera sp.]|nr:DUF167 domain-containing protein [Phycisphaera sp.]
MDDPLDVIELREEDRDDALYLRLHVVPGARRPRVVGRYGDRLKVKVIAPPERGRANEALLELLATSLDLARSRLVIERGDTSPSKTVRIDIADLDEKARAALLGRLGRL